MFTSSVCWYCCMIFFCILHPSTSAHNDNNASYVAMVVQHSPILAGKTAREIYTANLKAYAQYLQETVVDQGVQIAVFPEYGLGNLVPNREHMVPFCESVKVGEHYCNNNNKNNNDNHDQVEQLSCLALKYNIVLIADTCDAVPCDPTTDANCTDGFYLYNTQIAISATGKILAKYHKSHLFSEVGILDEPPLPYKAVTFDSHFGITFGMFVCYDLDFVSPVELLIEQGIDNFVFSSWWLNMPPFTLASMYQSGWARVNQANLLASNSGAGNGVAGSGIYAFDGRILKSTFDMTQEGPQNVVLVATVPVASSLSSTTSSQTSASSLSANNNDNKNENKKDEAEKYVARKKVSSSSSSSSSSACLGPGTSHHGSYTPGTCLFFHADKPPHAGTFSVSNGTTTCEISFSVNPQHTHASVDRWVLFASDVLVAYPGSQPLHTRCCLLALCASAREKDGNVACAPVWNAASTDFAKLQFSAEFATLASPTTTTTTTTTRAKQGDDTITVLSAAAVGNAQVIDLSDVNTTSTHAYTRVSAVFPNNNNDNNNKPLYSMMHWALAD